MRNITDKDIEFNEELERLKKKYEELFEKWRKAFDNGDPKEREIEKEYKNEVEKWKNKFYEYGEYLKSTRN